MLGFGLAIGGLTIAFVGITQVFVPTDLVYLGVTAQLLADWNEHLIPLIAHDRAGFGGALFSLAVAIAGSALWGVKPRRKLAVVDVSVGWNTRICCGITGPLSYWLYRFHSFATRLHSCAALCVWPIPDVPVSGSEGR